MFLTYRMDMKTIFAFLLCLLAVASAQLIYPDEFERMKTSTVPIYYYTQQPKTPVYPSTAYTNPSLQVYTTVHQPSVAFSSIQPAASSSNRELSANAYAAQSESEPAVSNASSLAETLPQRWGNHVNNIISRGIMKFTLDMDKAVFNTGNQLTGNVIFSPLSLSVTLAMVLLGSAGRTFDEVSRVLGLEAGVDISMHSEVVHQMFGMLLSIVDNKVAGTVPTGRPRVNSASGIFVQEGFPIRPEFRAISENVYKSETINLDFERRGKEAQDTINAWVRDRTMGKIANILNDQPSSLTKVILASALYFMGEWNQHFLQGATKRKPFYTEPNVAVDVDMMFNGGTFPFFEDRQLGAKIIELPYKGSEVSMFIILPKAEGARNMRAFKDKLTADVLEHLILSVKNETCIVGLPRMKLSSTLSLRRALQNLGLISLFDPNTADLSVLSPGNEKSTAAVSPKMESVSVTQPVTSSQTRPTTSRGALGRPNDVLIFSRFGEEQTPAVTKRNFFKYTDKFGHTVEQWATGFFIRKERLPRESTRRIRRSVSQEKNPSYEIPEKREEKIKVVGLEDNKYRFAERPRQRTKRQSRQLNKEFLEYVRSQNFSNYGLDNLRNRANFGNPGLYADDVLHKVEIDINEKGTEAAAVTSVILERDGDQKRLLANRPFIFFIRHNPSKLLLFWGTVNTPMPNYAVYR